MDASWCNIVYSFAAALCYTLSELFYVRNRWEHLPTFAMSVLTVGIHTSPNHPFFRADEAKVWTIKIFCAKKKSKRNQLVLMAHEWLDSNARMRYDGSHGSSSRLEKCDSNDQLIQMIMTAIVFNSSEPYQRQWQVSKINIRRLCGAWKGNLAFWEDLFLAESIVSSSLIAFSCRIHFEFVQPINKNFITFTLRMANEKKNRRSFAIGKDRCR